MDYKGKIITKNPVEPSQTSAPGVWTLNDATQAIKENNWPIANVPNPISRSLRFNSGDSTYLNRTPASAGNRKTWTWSGWVKRSALGTNQTLLMVRSNGTNYDQIRWNSDNTLYFFGQSAGVDSYRRNTTQVFRDVSGWYHLVAAFDSTEATASNRVKMYVNGTQITAFSASSDPTLNFDSFVNSTVVHLLGGNNIDAMYSDQYLTEVNFIDGQALDPTYFGMTDPRTGAWIPKKYSGTYGTNGFYLNFSDNSSTAALGTDYSGNSNTWTTNNFSVTAGSDNDSMVDVPTQWTPYNTTGDVGGLVRGNYCTLNPLAKDADVTLSNGNLDFITASSSEGGCIATMAVTTGKWYWEATVASGLGPSCGIAKLPLADYNPNPTGTYLYLSGGSKRLSPVSGSSDSAYGDSYGTGDVIGTALDLDAGTVTFYKNGVSQGVAFSSLSGTFTAWIQDGSTGTIASWVTNFGQRPFEYTPPAGFKSLCTTNLPEPTILDGAQYFETTLYTGDGTNQNIVNDAGMQPNLVWVKIRNNPYSHNLTDSVRGAPNSLQTDTTSGETTNGLLAFNSNGFQVNGSLGELGTSGNSYVAWQWKESATSGFDIVTYTGTGSAQNINHNLGVAPSMIIVKNRTTGATNWQVYSSVLGATKRLFLDLTDGANTYSGAWNDTEPTSSVFTVGSATDVNGSGSAMVAYLFAAVPGFSAFGSYTGNGSADGPFIYTGFRPAWVMVKRTNSTENWQMSDDVRNGGYNVVNKQLLANSSAAENTEDQVDYLSNGFKVRASGTGWNASGSTYIYAAFAENPFKYSNAR